jgi:hypothetical protein
MSWQKLPQSVVRAPIDDLELSVRSYNALRRRGVKFVGQLLQLSDKDLLGFGGLGRKSLQNIQQALQAFLQSRSNSAGAPTIQLEGSKATGCGSGKPSPGGWLVPEPVCADLNTPVARLDLSTRVRNVFNRLEIETIKQVLDYPKHKLFWAGNFGRRSLAEVQVKLFEYLSGKGVVHSLAPSTESGTRAFVDQLLSVLSERQRNVVQDRYGLWDGVAETLQDVGDKMGLTRERIRQIETNALRRLRRIYDRVMVEDLVRAMVAKYLRENAEAKLGVLNEDEAMGVLAGDCSDEQASLALAFFQDLWPQEHRVFARCLFEVEEGVFCLEEKTNRVYRKVLGLVESALEQRQEPLRQCWLFQNLSAQLEGLAVPNASELLHRVLAISPSLALLQDGTVALSRWSEFGRRNAQALAEVALRVIGEPAHFKDI